MIGVAGGGTAIGRRISGSRRLDRRVRQWRLGRMGPAHGGIRLGRRPRLWRGSSLLSRDSLLHLRLRRRDSLRHASRHRLHANRLRPCNLHGCHGRRASSARHLGVGRGLAGELAMQVHANGRVFADQQHQQDAHDDQVSDHGAGQPREVHQQNRHEQAEPEGDQVQLGHGALAAQHGDHLVQKLDAGRHAARRKHHETQPAVLLEVDAVQEAHDGKAEPAHGAGHHHGDGHDDHEHHHDDQVELLALGRVRPGVGHLQQHGLVDKAAGQQDGVRGEVQRVVVQLVVVGQRAFHDELRHVVDEVVHEQRHEQREALLEQGYHALGVRAARLRRLKLRQREREHHERERGDDGHDDARNAHVARDEQRQREPDERRGGPERLRDAGKVELINLLQAALVDIG